MNHPRSSSKEKLVNIYIFFSSYGSQAQYLGSGVLFSFRMNIKCRDAPILIFADMETDTGSMSLINREMYVGECSGIALLMLGYGGP